MFRSFLICALALALPALATAEELPGTKPLTMEGDIAAQMVAGIDKYLMRELDAACQGDAGTWKLKTDTLEAYLESVRPHRERLAKILGVVDERIKPVTMEYIGEGTPSPVVAETERYKVYSVRWSVLPGVDGEGLLLEPTGKAKASVVAIPDADQTPEMLVGLAPGIPAESQFARRLGESGCRVIVPVLIDRKDTWSGNPSIKRQTNLSHREFIWRMAYEMGRHIFGYEIQKVLAAVDWLKAKDENFKVGVYGYGEGGLVALYSGALDPRISATVASGATTPGDVDLNDGLVIWQQPIDRSIWGVLPEFRLFPWQLFGWRGLIFELALPPKIDGPPVRKGHHEAALGRIDPLSQVVQDIGRIRNGVQYRLHSGQGVNYESIYQITPLKGLVGNEYTLECFLDRLGAKPLAKQGVPPKGDRPNFDATPRQKRQFDQLVAFTQKLWRQSEPVRKEFWAKADTSSPEKWEQSCEYYRDYFWNEIIGKLPKQSLPPNPRTRLAYDTPKWKGYEVVLDLYPDVFAYGILCVPKDLKPGEKRPVVVCQHGLEGRPQDVVEPKKLTNYYRSFGAQLADMGYIVYAPQNPYIGRDKFRILLRKAHPLKLSLYSFIVRQHETTTDWLASLPFVRADKIAFYGLSYGGKTAMRIPPLVKRYCLSICSGDFNEWIGKNVSIDFHGSYMWTFEYDMYEFNLGYTFNYAEMANLIAPRPFMVERGHDDGVGVDEMIAYEYAKVRYLYANRLKIPQNTAIEFRPGGHEVFLKGTADFLKKHTGWPR
jgi:dienelactone hydrolase